MIYFKLSINIICIFFIFITNINANEADINEINKKNNPDTNKIIQNIDISSSIAIINIDKILANSVAMNQLKITINNVNDKLQKNMLEKERELKHNEQELINERGKIAPHLFKEKVQEFNKKVALAQKHAQFHKNKLEKLYRESINKINLKIKDLVTEAAKKDKLKFVSLSNQFIYYETQLDITDNIIEKLNLINIDFEINENNFIVNNENI